MSASLRRFVSIYGTFAAMTPKAALAYNLWFWISLILNTIALTIFVFFWRAVYAGGGTVAGLTLQTTLTFILLARIFEPLTNGFVLWEFGVNLREGGIAHMLLRPIDLQASYYVISLAQLALELVWQVPIALVATFVFGLRWPTDPAVWAAFIAAALLGRSVLFFFDWIMGCLTFYTTEVWGLSVMVFGMALFFSGGLVPLEMMPAWLRALVQAVPFVQVLYVPVSILSGLRPLADVPGLLLGQALWLVGLLVASRLFFRVAVRKVTVHGG